MFNLQVRRQLYEVMSPSANLVPGSGELNAMKPDQNVGDVSLQDANALGISTADHPLASLRCHCHYPKLVDQKNLKPFFTSYQRSLLSKAAKDSF